jgi:hypothetical protein
MLVKSAETIINQVPRCLTMAITREQARADLERMMPLVEVTDGESQYDVAAQHILGALEVLEVTLRGSHSTVIKMYFIQDDKSKFLPLTIRKVVREYLNADLSEADALEKVREFSGQYRETFQRMGITPKVSKAMLDARRG